MFVDIFIIKVMYIENFGVYVVLEGNFLLEVGQKVCEIVNCEQRVWIYLYDDFYVIFGQGIVGFELFEDVLNFDVFVLLIGGGGFIFGVVFVVRYLNFDI